MEYLNLSDASIKIIAQVLQSIIENPFEESMKICQRLNLTKDQLKEYYSIIQRSEISQKILEFCFPRHYSFFKEKVLFKEYWKDVFENNNPYPFEVEIHPSEICNLKCEFCPSLNNNYKDQNYYRDLKSQISDHNTLMKRIGALFTELKLGGTWGVIFSGGKEPTLAPNIVDFINIAKKSGLSVKITTNGSGFMIPRKCETKKLSGSDLFKFYAFNLRRIHLSLNECDRNLFNIKKGLNKSSDLFNQIVSNIRKIAYWRDKLRERGKSAVELYIAIIIDRYNYRRISDVIEFMVDLGADVISINRYQYQMLNKEDPFSEYEIKKILKELIRIKRNWLRNKTKLIVSVEDFRNDYYKRILRQEVRCWVTASEFAINPVFLGLACDTAAFPGRELFRNTDFKLGYVFKHPDFKSYWNQNYKIRKNISSKNCPDCRFSHMLINVYVEKVYHDYNQGFKLCNQPFYTCKNLLV